MMGLTPQMAVLKVFIAEFSAQHGYGPNYDEMREHLGIRSKSGVAGLVCGLEERGHIRRLYNRARAIEVVTR